MAYYPEQFYDSRHDIVGYYDNGELVAWTMVYKITSEVAESLQFAWNYKNPKLHLGIKSLRNECALYKSLGYRYYMLGEADEYKTKINGFEILGPR